MSFQHCDDRVVTKLPHRFVGRKLNYWPLTAKFWPTKLVKSFDFSATVLYRGFLFKLLVSDAKFQATIFKPTFFYEKLLLAVGLLFVFVFVI